MFKTRNRSSFSLVQSAFPWRRFGHIETIYRNFFSASLPSLKSASRRTKTHNSVTLSPASPVQRTDMTMSLTPTLPPSISLSSSNPRAANAFRVSYNKLCVRNSKAEGPLRRPSAPLKEATPPMRPIPPSPPSADPPPPRPSPPATSSAGSRLTISTVTLEYQRQKAKELQEYFRDKKAEDQASQGLVFGFTQKNEISNGRYIIDEIKDKNGKDLDVSTWEQEYVEVLPKQKTRWDCGMFMIKYADFPSQDLTLNFCQENVLLLQKDYKGDSQTKGRMKIIHIY